MITRKSRKLRGDQQGTATIELAIATPVLLMFALGGIDLALGFVHKLEVQQYAQIGADYVMSEMETVPTDVEIKARVHEGSGVPLGDITVERWIECDGEKNSLPACINAGFDYTQYLSIEVDQDYEPILDIEGYADFVDTFTATGSVTLQVE
ncbi:pilus assembly protein [Qipengyuania sp. XHP0211]|uniref:TadE/TadG family type IV pilus assembly protein n=1 Tax=Qipengyuania sp. XHP0211 TaxID=3038079 RepID=UPI00241D8F55|nr:TadE/TadG family type IV pilus assembly protein [Qipengyuania sp. XHP0211]MDG5751220.1 pilus assembly protein [Qipengyuania sp. XHP0211]